jgi:hypothetical protein
VPAALSPLGGLENQSLRQFGRAARSQPAWLRVVLVRTLAASPHQQMDLRGMSCDFRVLFGATARARQAAHDLQRILLDVGLRLVEIGHFARIKSPKCLSK